MEFIQLFVLLISIFSAGILIALTRILKELLSISSYLDSMGEMWGEMLRELITNLNEPEVDQDEDYNERPVGEDGL